MTTHLQVHRQSLIDELGTAVPPNRRIELQRQLSEINAEIKRINTVEAARKLAEAEQRKARGREEQAKNLERAAANRADSNGARAEAERPPGTMSRGEYLLKNANQMLRKLDTIEHPLPFTIEFQNALVAYIAEQRLHVRDVAARKEAATVRYGDPNWKQTWADTGVLAPAVLPPAESACPMHVPGTAARRPVASIGQVFADADPFFGKVMNAPSVSPTAPASEPSKPKKRGPRAKS